MPAYVVVPQVSLIDFDLLLSQFPFHLRYAKPADLLMK
jgi:hypothetical protein